MIIKITSTQSYDENGERPYFIIDTDTLPKDEREKYIDFQKRNHKAGLLKMEVLKQ